MTRQEALILIGAEEADFEEIVIHQIFEHKQFLLKSAITPQVFRTRAKKIAILNEGYKFLIGKSDTIRENVELKTLHIENISIEALLTFYRNYESLMSQFKLSFMQLNDPYEVSYFCHQLANLEHQKLLQINDATLSIKINSLMDVKISDFVNSGEVINELKSTESGQIATDNIINFPSLLKDSCMSRKYANFTKLKEEKNA